jgi:acetolactate synthase-1/2/3 large subunit
VKIVLMDNASLGLVQQQQELFYGERVYASRYAASPDFTAIARGFGLQAVDLDTVEDPRAALRDLLNAPGPCLIHASIDRDARVYPMVPPGAANTQMIGA